MSKRSKRRMPSVGRDVFTPSLAMLPRRITIPIPVDLGRDTLRVLEDRRTFRPDKSIRPPAATHRAASRVVDKVGRNVRGQVFAVPDRVVMCARRKRRKEVFHALGLAGRRGHGGGKPRRVNFWSKIGC